MPTIHAVGGPAKACATTRVRCSGSVHVAIAAMPAARIVEIPIHIGICASASSVNDGAAALASDPTARSTLATPSSARGEYRVSSRPATSAATTASGAARIRSCPAAAIETPKSSATSLRIGERTSTPAWLATNARKSTTEGDASAWRSRAEGGVGSGERCRAEPMPDRVAVRRGHADTACPRNPGCGEPNAARGVLASHEWSGAWWLTSTHLRSRTPRLRPVHRWIESPLEVAATRYPPLRAQSSLWGLVAG